MDITVCLVTCGMWVPQRIEAWHWRRNCLLRGISSSSQWKASKRRWWLCWLKAKVFLGVNEVSDRRAGKDHRCYQAQAEWCTQGTAGPGYWVANDQTDFVACTIAQMGLPGRGLASTTAVDQTGDLRLAAHQHSSGGTNSPGAPDRGGSGRSFCWGDQFPGGFCIMPDTALEECHDTCQLDPSDTVHWYSISESWTSGVPQECKWSDGGRVSIQGCGWPITISDHQITSPPGGGHGVGTRCSIFSEAPDAGGFSWSNWATGFCLSTGSCISEVPCG